MTTPTLATASNLLEMLEFSLINAPKIETSSLPMNGMLEIIRQVRLIVEQNQPILEKKTNIQDEMFDNSFFGINGKTIVGRSNLGLELETEKISRSDSEIPGGNQSINYRPKVRTVPPEVRGKIRELVGIESEETF
jgi:hypothetical protein